ncbi:cardiomyopathy-associated protein 5 isoform X2 [Eublepharis macularius]|uniref:Cardiomyopathy-associated protein 5 isoform X2 n=1 Tax=Eublepharis macularius TaxID=481883 RepID=A0AA97L5F3_EUBMA|nr:cardiomyopathy-associated protein 5 isoform X2 [Eublepharis macularius]
METYCNSVDDESPDVSVEDEEEDEDEPQGQPLTKSLKNLNQSSGRGKTKSPDEMDIVQSEDSGLTWETSSSRCSTSQASETSATSGIYSMDNSYMDSPPGKFMDEEKTAQKTSNSLEQMPSFPNQNTHMGSKKEALSVKHMQVTCETKELDPADPHSWPFQVQPSKIKDYLIQITQDVENPLSEEKENNLKKKGELPLKGTVRARIEQITAVLEERNKKIFRRVSGKDLPSNSIRKPKEPPKICSRQGISVSLRHIERDTRDKNNKKEILRYNLKPVQTNISKPGVSAFYKKDERKTRKPVPSETLNKEKPSPILMPLTDKVNKLGNESYSLVTQTSVSGHAGFDPSDHQYKMVKKAKSFLPDPVSVMSEKSSSLADETEKQTMEQYLPMATEVPHISEAPSSTLDRETAQPCPAICEVENQMDSTAGVLSESAAQDVPYPNIMKPEAVQKEHEHSLPAETGRQNIELHPSQLEMKDLALLHSAKETGRQVITPYSLAESSLEEAEPPPSVMETERQEMKPLEVEYLKADAQKQPATKLETEPDHRRVLPSVEESETKEVETSPEETEPPPSVMETEKQEMKPLEVEYLKADAQKQPATKLETQPDHRRVLPSVEESETKEVETSPEETEPPPSVMETEKQEMKPLEVEYLKADAQKQPATKLETEPDHRHVLPSVEESETKEVETSPEETEPPPSVMETEKQEMKPLEVEYLKADAQKQPTTKLETEPDHRHVLPSVEESETKEVETSPLETEPPPSVMETERQEMKPLEVEYLKADAQKQPATKLETQPDHRRVLPSVEESETKEVETSPEETEPPPSVMETERQEMKPLEVEYLKADAQKQPTTKLETQPDHRRVLPSVEESETKEVETSPEETEPPPSVMETERQEMKPLEVEYLKADAQKQPATKLETEPDHRHVLHSVEELKTRDVEILPDLSSTDHRTEIQEQQSVEHFGLPQIPHFMGETEKEETEQLGLNLEKQDVLMQTPVTVSLQPKFQEVSYPRDKAENQTIQLEIQHLDSLLPIPTAQSEEVHQHSVLIVQSESEQPVISEPIKTLQGTAYAERSHLREDTEARAHSPTEICDKTSEQLLPISSLLTDNVEKQETQPSSLATAIPQSEQTHSILPYPAEQMETQDNLLCSPEKATLSSEVPLLTVAIQNADATKLEIQPDSTTKAPSEELASLSRESVVAEDKTIQPDLPLSAEPPSEASVRLQEVAKLENHTSPSIKTNLHSEVQDASHHMGEEGQEGGHHLFTTTQLEMKPSVAFETENQNIKTNNSIPSQLEMEPTIALSCFDEADDNIMHQSIAEPSHPDSLCPVHMPEKQERVPLEMEETPHLLSSISLQKESNISHSVEEMVINGIQLHSPASAEDLSETVCSADLQDNVNFSTRPAAPDSRLLYTPNSEAMTCDIEAPELEHVAKQLTQAAVAKLEPSYVQVLESVSESRKDFDVPLPALGAEEGDRFVTPRSDQDHLILSDAEGKEAEHYSSVTPTSTAAPEPQGSQRYSSNEASKQSPMISSFFVGDTQSLVSSVLPPEQSYFLLSDHNKKEEKEENQSLSPEKPETFPEELVSITAFLKGETKEEPLHSSGVVKIMSEESKSILEDFASEAVKEIATSFPLVSEECLSKETSLPFVVDTAEEQNWSHSLLTKESKQLAAEEEDAEDDQSHLLSTTQSERKNEAIQLCCPVTAQLELEGRTLLNSNKGISKQEIPQHLLSTVQSAPVYQELLYHKEERGNQERIALETEHSKFLQSPVLQQESEHTDILQPTKEMERETIQLCSSAAVQDLSQPASEKGTLEFQGYLPKTAEVDFGVSKSSESTDEAQKKEIQLPRLEAEELDYNQLASSLLTDIMEKQGICSHSPEASVSAVLGQSNSALMDFTEKAKKPEVQPCPETLATEEPLSIAAFLLSEAKEMQTSFLKTAKEENRETQLPFKEPDLLVEGSKSGSAWTLETDVAIKKEIQSSQTEFETEQLSRELQAEVTDQDNRENICNIPIIPNLILNEPSDIVLQEPMNDTQPWSADSDQTTSKSIVISTENISESEDIKHLPQTNITWEEPENYLQKEKELKDNEKPRKNSTATPELDQGKDASSNPEDHETGNLDIPPLASSVDKEEDTHMPEKLKDLETVSTLKTKPFHLIENSIVDQRTSTCKPGTKTSDSLKTANFENKESELKELVRETDVQGSINNEKEILTVPENENDGILNAAGLDYFGKHTMTDNSSFTQTGKEQSDQVEQRPVDITKENAEETTSPAASLENILEFSLLESKLDETFNGVIRKEKVTTHKDISKVLNEDKRLDSVKKNDKNIEEELNLVGVPLFNTEKGILSQPPLTPFPNTTVDPQLIAGQSAEASWNRDLYEKAEEDRCKYPSDENIKDTDVPFHRKLDAPDDEIAPYFERGIPKDDSSNNLEDSQAEKVLKNQHVKEEPRVLQGAYESHKKECESVCIPAEATAQAGLLSSREIVKGMNDGLTAGPAEIANYVRAVTCKPTHAIPFGGRSYLTGATSDESSQDRVEESPSSETSQVLPEETSDEESSPILDYAASVYQKEAFVQDESKDVTCLATDQTQPSEITEDGVVDNDMVRKPVEEGAQFHEACHHVSPQSEEQFVSVLEPMAQGTYALNHEHLSSWDLEDQPYEKSVGENIASDLAKHNREDTSQQLSASEAKSEKAFGEFDFTLLSHDFESYPLYSIKEEEYSDDDDLAELMEYEMVTQDDVFQEETPSEVAHEELLFGDRKSLEHISDSCEFVSEKEANTYAEEEELMGLEKLPKNVTESEVLLRKTELAQLENYCCECKCPISADGKLWGEHKDHSVTNLDTGVTELKGQLDGFLDVLQERSLKIEGFVSEIEALFNTLEENCKGKEQLLEVQNENIVKTVLEHHDQKAQRFEEIKNTKMEYLYEQMVIFQEYMDTAKETLETIIKETEEMDDFVFLSSSEEINKRLLSAVEDILTLEKMPTAFSHFEHFAGNSATGDWALEHMPVPKTPKLQPQEPNSATSTSIAVYWTVSEDDVIDFFQVYCVEEHPRRQEQSGLVEEYRVTVKESNCILEDLEPGHCYSVWIMAVNYTGCSFPSEKSIFRTAPPTPVIKAEDCTVCWDTATIRWSTGNLGATDSFTLEYCRQYSPEGEGLRSLAGIKRPELQVNLEPNINYFFYVRAVNVFGTSEQSEAALISTKGTRFHIMKETVHPALQVSPNGTTICLPKETQITGISTVWGELLSSRGLHYWEVTVTGCESYKTGICYSTVPPDSVLGQNISSWCLYCSSKTSLVYKVLHNGKMSDVIVTEQPARVGILLDYNAGRLLFFNAERGQVLFAIRQKFTAAVHPAFGLEQPGILHLHTGMELPEFVKHS